MHNLEKCGSKLSRIEGVSAFALSDVAASNTGFATGRGVLQFAFRPIHGVAGENLIAHLIYFFRALRIA